MEICVKSFDGEKYTVEVGVDDTTVDLRRKVASAAELREDGFDMSFGEKVMVEGDDITQLSAGDTVVLTKTTLSQKDTIAALHALGVRKLTAETLMLVRDPKVASLLLQAEVATAIPNYFFTGSSVTSIVFSCVSDVDDNCGTTLHLPALPSVTTICNNFLYGCRMLSTADLSGLQAVTTIGNNFLYGCTWLSTADLSGLQAVTTIGNGFLSHCTSLSTADLSDLQAVTTIGDCFLNDCTTLSTVDISGLQAVTTIGDGFLGKCPALQTIRGGDSCSNVVRSRVLPHRNTNEGQDTCVIS